MDMYEVKCARFCGTAAGNDKADFSEGSGARITRIPIFPAGCQGWQEGDEIGLIRGNPTMIVGTKFQKHVGLHLANRWR